MNYRYSARDPMGRKVEGEIEAPSRDDVVRELKGRALEPLAVHPLPPRKDSVRAAEAERTEAASTPADLTEILYSGTPGGTTENEKKSGSSWFGILFLILYVLYKFFG